MASRCLSKIRSSLLLLDSLQTPKKRGVLDLQSQVLEFSADDFKDSDIKLMNNVFLKSNKTSEEMVKFLLDCKQSAVSESHKSQGKLH